MRKLDCSIFSRIASGRMFLLCLLLVISVNALASLPGTKGVATIKSDSFISSDYQATSDKSISVFELGLQTPGLQKGSTGYDVNEKNGLEADINSQFSPGHPQMASLNIRELFYQESGLAIGRKKQSWSQLDESWHLGLYQPQNRARPLQPESQGLTGVFAHFDGQFSENSKPWSLMLFGSMISIPDQGPSYSLHDGKFENINPWFPTPSSQANIVRTGEVDQIRYNLISPETNKILFQKSFVAEFEIGDRNQGLHWQMAYAYKPSSQLALGVNGVVVIGESIQANILPATNYHRLLSADLRWKESKTSFGVGIVNEKPSEAEFEPEWTRRIDGESTLLAAEARLQVAQFDFCIGALDIQSETAQAAGPDVSRFGTLLPTRFPFKSAVRGEASVRQFWKKYEGVRANLSYLQGLDADYSQVLASIDYQWQSRWTLGAQLLLVQAQNEESAKKTIFSAYQNHDSFSTGVTYVF